MFSGMCWFGLCFVRVLNGHLGGRQVLLVEKSEKYVEHMHHCQTFTK